MKLHSLSVLLLLQTTTAKVDFYPQTCNANPGCAALGLADDCCPTNLAGIFLDCCDDLNPSCDANPGCSGLADECCPTADGTFLYCCFASPKALLGHRFDAPIFASENDTDQMEYWLSTGTGRLPPREKYEIRYEYTRDSKSLYDLIYLRGDVSDAGAYVTGEKLFSLRIEATSAPECTQVILSLDSIRLSQADNYPRGRHSRYLATITPGQERIEFDFLDRPDEGVLDSQVDSIAILFAPGTYSGDFFTFYDLNSNVRCTSTTAGEGCDKSPTKSCPALHVQLESRFVSSLAEDFDVIVVEGGDEILEDLAFVQADEQDTTTAEEEDSGSCSVCSDPSCMGGSGKCSIVTSYAALAPDPNFSGRASTSGGIRRFAYLLGFAVMDLLSLIYV